MLANQLQQLIDDGLVQPGTEPTYFTYPVGYDLINSEISNTTFPVSAGPEHKGNTLDAKLEPST